ncbi:MAG: prolyl oligopeptidase family serine peptidase, partial [Eubacteriales bacterium]|nr:prolyl oligopeptidase family serine peptidase [Eubacteriales bacterium]
MRMIKILLSVVLVSALLMSSALPAFADAEVLEKDMIFRYMRDKRFTSSGTKLPYRMYVPEDYDEAQEYPLVVFFHGAGERGNDNRFQVIYPYSIVSRLLTEENRKNYKCIIIAPQCATGFQWVDTPWSKGSYSINEVPESEFMKATMALIESVKREYSIADDRVYATGISMGGFGTWDIISRHEELFAAAVPICGSGDPFYAEVLKDMPIWTFHGSADTSVPVEGTREMVEALIAAGSDSIRYTEYENEEHNVWNKAYVEDDLVSWLFEQTRASLVFDASYRANEGGRVSLPEKVPYGESMTVTI